MDNSTLSSALIRWEEPTIEGITSAWLDAKAGRTNSEKTRRAYADVLLLFRTALLSVQVDLDGDPIAVSLVAQAWAAKAWKDGRAVKSGTYNQRLAILSSWYRYAMQKAPRRFTMNPISLVERKPTQEYASARSLSPKQVKDVLTGMNRASLAGLRDYAVLTLALTTGRRAAELAGLRWKHVQQISDGRVLVHFDRCKGGKQMDDLLSPPVSAALLDWLGQAYGDLKRLNPEAPLWGCLSHRDWGKPVTTRGLGLIWQKHLGTSKVHTTRHTFARTMEDAGAKPSDITMRLAQDNPVSVARYLARLRREENQFADSLATLFGLSGEA